ncbi:S8 family peptidase [Microbacterium sp. Leaf159]|uniref:S8 family peptidase n=1 Tax=Microbacterium sp. Leaf159 TaxID=1736279 RepID=UPI00138EFFCC|nr:S8/S53 family peptidase [Microbacterium sp. Leaf159]
MRIPAIHDSGITGDGVTIAVFDGALNPEIANLQGVDLEVRQLDACPDPLAAAASDFEALQHGTSVTSLIVGNGTSDSGVGPVGLAPGVRILYYGSLQEGCEGNPFPAALADAVAQGADIVTMSGGNGRLVEELSQKSADGVAAALRAGVVVVASLPNADSTWEGELGKINGVVNVASVDATAQAAKAQDGSPMTNDDVDVVAPGVDVAGVGWDRTWGMSAWSGNSAATPIVAGLLALAKEKWPDATASQLLQSLIRNTGSAPHELQWSNTFGHGTVNATRVIEEDPSQYPDENPLFTDGQVPTFDEVFAETDPLSTGAPDPSEERVSGVVPWAIAGGVLVAIAVVIVIMISRRKSGGHDNV